MPNKKRYIFIGLIIMLAVFVTVAQDGKETNKDDEDVNEFGMSEEEILKRGEYLTYISGCVRCHTLQKEEYLTDDKSSEQLQVIGLTYNDTLDVDNQLLAGGRVFRLGPAGILIAPNLTPHETGLGDWTDEEIETSMRVGISKDGRQLHPLMPYLDYFSWPKSDMQAVIQYLKSLPPVDNELEVSQLTGEVNVPELAINDDLPDLPPSDKEELGAYLTLNVMNCDGCHTPADPDTGRANLDMLFAGGQPFNGPWGVVYGGNITPDDETGIGTWETEDYSRVLREGVRIDGRHLVFMPWQDYRSLTGDDLDAVVTYLQLLEPIENEVPAPAIEEIYLSVEER